MPSQRQKDSKYRYLDKVVAVIMRGLWAARKVLCAHRRFHWPFVSKFLFPSLSLTLSAFSTIAALPPPCRTRDFCHQFCHHFVVLSPLFLPCYATTLSFTQFLSPFLSPLFLPLQCCTCKMFMFFLSPHSHHCLSPYRVHPLYLFLPP